MGESTKKQLVIEDFNKINLEISVLLIKLKEYDSTEIAAALKNLRAAGNRVSNFYYGLIENNEMPKKEQS